MDILLKEKLEWEYDMFVEFVTWVKSNKTSILRPHLLNKHLEPVGEKWWIDLEKYDRYDDCAFIDDLKEEMYRQQLPDGEYYLRGFKFRTGKYRGRPCRHWRYLAHFYKIEGDIEELRPRTSRPAPKGRHVKVKYGNFTTRVYKTKPAKMFALNQYFREA